MKSMTSNLIKSIAIIAALFFSLAVNALTYTVTADSFTETPGNQISSDISNPTIFDFDPGSNLTTFTTDTSQTGADYIAFTLGTNEILGPVTLTFFSTVDGGADNVGFFGIIDANGGYPDSEPGVTGLLSGALFGEDNVGSDLLTIPTVDPQQFGAPGGFSFADVSTLTAGSYLFWFNETGAENTYTLDFQLSVVDVAPTPTPVPAALYLLLAPLATLAAFRRKKKAS